MQNDVGMGQVPLDVTTMAELYASAYYQLEYGTYAEGIQHADQFLLELQRNLIIDIANKIKAFASVIESNGFDDHATIVGTVGDLVLQIIENPEWKVPNAK